MALPNSLARQLEEQGRYILAAGVAEGRRILDIGRGYANGLVALAEAGATELHVRSDDPHPLKGALDDAGLEGVHVTGAAAWPLPYANEAFDLVICHDLAGRMAEDPAWETELRRVLSPDGYLITAVANPEGQFISELFGERYEPAISYQDLVGQLQQNYGAVTVFGQSPLAASLFFDFEDTSEETGLTLDRSLLPDADEQPGWYLVVLGPEAYHRDDLCIVQLPFDTMVAATNELLEQGTAAEETLEEKAAEEEEAEGPDEVAAAPTHGDVAAHATQQAALETAERVIRSLETELQMTRAQVQAAQEAWLRDKPKDDPAAQQALSQAQATITKLERQLVGSQDVVAVLETDLANTRRQLKDAQTAQAAAQEAAQGIQQVEALQLKVQTMEAEATVLRQDQERLAEAEREITRNRNDRASFEAQIRDLLEETAALRQSEDAMRTELQTARDELQGHSAHAARQKAHLEHEQARMAAELAQARQASVTAVTPPAAMNRTHDSIGRELDTAVDELEDLLKDVAPPISSGR